ncbi:MAG: hypothetical protein ACP5N9_01125 [Candidatus Bilamarchaeum sp.]|jgi:hypothetical protein
MSKKVVGGTVIAIIMALAALIGIAKFLFPIFGILAILSFIWLIVTSQDSYGDVSTPAIVLCILLVLTGVTYFIGDIIGNSPFGIAVTGVANAFDTLENVQKNVSIQVLDAAQETTSETYQSSNMSNRETWEKSSNATYEITKTLIKVS